MLNYFISCVLLIICVIYYNLRFVDLHLSHLLQIIGDGKFATRRTNDFADVNIGGDLDKLEPFSFHYFEHPQICDNQVYALLAWGKIQTKVIEA